jgi:hypothetical protein
MMGIVNNKIVQVPFSEAIKDEKLIDKHLVDILQVLCV